MEYMKPDTKKIMTLSIGNRSKIEYSLKQLDENGMFAIEFGYCFDGSLLVLEDNKKTKLVINNFVEVSINENMKTVDKNVLLKFVNNTSNPISFINDKRYHGYVYKNEIHLILGHMVEYYKTEYVDVITILPNDFIVINLFTHSESVHISQVTGNPRVEYMW
jgi:hypothetical protein